MVWLVLCACILFTGGLTEANLKAYSPHPADNVFYSQQINLLELFRHIQEPIYNPEIDFIARKWNFEENINKYTNSAAVTQLLKLLDSGILPRGVPFAVLNKTHSFELLTFFEVLFYAQDYDTFYQTAAWGRAYLNEELFVIALSVAILNRHDTQRIFIPAIYEIFPWYFCSGEVMATAQKINIHGMNFVDDSSFIWNNNVVIKSKLGLWPYVNNEENKVSYFTNDISLNNYYYSYHLTNPKWLSKSAIQLKKNDRRGEWAWFTHKQMYARYNLERISNGLKEVPDLDSLDTIEFGFSPGLTYPSGIPMPERPAYFKLREAHNNNLLSQIGFYENRIYEAIDKGYIVNCSGNHISIRDPKAIDVITSVLESNVDSTNKDLYHDFMNIWKTLLGNSPVRKPRYRYGSAVPLLLPSAIENQQTAARDPAFYMFLKHCLEILAVWQKSLPEYKRDELAHPSVTIKKVQVDRMSTFFESKVMNVTNALYLSKENNFTEQLSVIVEQKRLNHKLFKIRLHVDSDLEQTVVVRCFLGPKYDNVGNEIPLHENGLNFFMIDQFIQNLPLGESVIVRDPAENPNLAFDPAHANDVYMIAKRALRGECSPGLIRGHGRRIDAFPYRLLLPKGSAGGLALQLIVHITAYPSSNRPPLDPKDSLGSGSRWHQDDLFGFPFNKPVYDWQVRGLTNFVQKEVKIYHEE